MFQSSQPLWIRSRREEVADAYKSMVQPLEEHAAALEASSRVNKDGQPCDDHGTASDYRMTARYCAKIAQGISPQAAEIKAAAAVKKGWSKERPTDPGTVQTMKRAEPKPPPMPEIDDALKFYATIEFLRSFTYREAQAMILTIGRQMSHRDAARQMKCSVGRVNDLIRSARSKFGTVPVPWAG